VEKPLSDFGFRKDRGSYKKHCKACYNRKHGKKDTARASEWNRRNPIRRRNITLAQYGLDVEGYEDLYAAQRGRCAICGTHESEACLGKRNNTRLHVDHNHKTGEVRGLLCHKCNLGIGYLNGDEGTANLEAAILYLSRSQT
jgi:hypothetical protein